jgi:hypothetical protein
MPARQVVKSFGLIAGAFSRFDFFIPHRSAESHLKVLISAAFSSAHCCESVKNLNGLCNLDVFSLAIFDICSP